MSTVSTCRAAQGHIEVGRIIKGNHKVTLARNFRIGMATTLYWRDRVARLMWSVSRYSTCDAVVLGLGKRVARPIGAVLLKAPLAGRRWRRALVSPALPRKRYFCCLSLLQWSVLRPPAC
jgi:hypothetical protein